MEGRWCSAAEVAADVSRAGGGVAPRARALADACLAWGARPAPLILTELEGQREPPAPEHGTAPAAPDLRGITRMLRMVEIDNTYDSSVPGGGAIVISRPPGSRPAPPHRPQCSPGARSHLATSHVNGNDATAVNTHLNPNVAEFVPRSGAPPARGGSPSGGSGSSGEGRAPAPAPGREELAARLRDDISGGRDKCSAIARLMRLYAEPEPESGSAKLAPRLLTPDYFERPAPATVPYDGTVDYSSGTEVKFVGSRNGSPSIRPREPEGGAEPAEMRASLDKVRRWLGGGEGGGEGEAPSLRPSPHLLVAPVTFRSRASPASPARTPPAPPASPAPSVTCAYSPPARAAAALHREYAARAAAAAQASAQPVAAAVGGGDTLWSRLEPQLRQKDAERRARDAASQ